MWKNVEINKQNIEINTGKSVLIKMPIKLISEMLEEQIRKKLINKSLEIGIDLGNGYSKQSYFKR